MGIKININTILRYDAPEPLEEGKEYPFEKERLTLFADDIQTWLTRKDWTALAEIQVTSQQRRAGKTTGTFVVEHVYDGTEQQLLTGVFRRMYGWNSHA
jgi:hypothetical protein